MKVYKFRLETKNQEDFIMGFEVKSNQTFQSLHDFIFETVKLEGKELASFHIVNNNWEKLIEITLIDMSGEADKKLKPNDEVQTIFVMSETVLDRFFYEPGQKMVYEYDFLQMQTFQLELLEINNLNKQAAYPRVTYSKGKFDKQQKINVEKDPDKLKAELLQEFNSIMKDDANDDYYNVESDY